MGFLLILNQRAAFRSLGSDRLAAFIAQEEREVRALVDEFDMISCRSIDDWTAVRPYFQYASEECSSFLILAQPLKRAAVVRPRSIEQLS